MTWIHVNVIEELSPSIFIVGDSTGLAIMEIAPGHEKHVEIGQGIRLLKPNKIIEDEISFDNKFTPMKTKPKTIPKPDDARIAALRAKSRSEPQKLKGPQINFVSFETIMNEYKEQAIVQNTLLYVTSVSRLIDGQYGKYRICNIRDTQSVALTLALYEPHIEKMEDHQVYKMTKLKKLVMKNDGSVRLATNRKRITGRS